MDNVIEKIIEIEYRAQNIVNEALQHCEYRSKEQIEDEIKKERDRIFSSVMQKVEKVREDNLRMARVQAKKFSRDTRVKVANLNKSLDSNKDKWVKLIVGNILGE
ncbi:UNVERIFIED_CONTAM: Vacuolar (H+)-ATPase G subunit [Acetivibrio alkalicellulosi]